MVQIKQYTSEGYYPFGMPMPGRTINPGEYRFGFNGQEKVDEVSGDGNHNTAEYWEYDTRLGRRWNIDPVDKPWMSPYHAFSNKPILNIDPNGANADKYYFDAEGNLDDYEATGEKDQYYFEDSKGSEQHTISHEGENKIVKNYTEKQDPGFAMLNIYVDPTGVGHTAIGTDGKTYGFYPSGGTKASMYSSEMDYSVLTSKNFLESRYSSANIYFIKVSTGEKASVLGYLTATTQSIDEGNGPTYTLWSNNCTTVASDALRFANIKFDNSYMQPMLGPVERKENIERFITPLSINSYLKNQYGRAHTPLIGWLDRGNAIAPSSEVRKNLGIGKDVFHN